MGGNIKIEIPQGKNPEVNGGSQEKVKDSKSLSRWVSRWMKGITKEAIRRCQAREVTMMRILWGGVGTTRPRPGSQVPKSARRQEPKQRPIEG
jgi:hypothetical protein